MDVITAGVLLDGGLAVLGLVVLYLVLRRAVRDGLLDAWAERPRQEALEAGAERLRGSATDRGARRGV